MSNSGIEVKVGQVWESPNFKRWMVVNVSDTMATLSHDDDVKWDRVIITDKSNMVLHGWKLLTDAP